MANIIDLGNVSNRSVVVTAHKVPTQFNPDVLAEIYKDKRLNPNAFAEIYSDNNYRKLRFEQLEDR